MVTTLSTSRDWLYRLGASPRASAAWAVPTYLLHVLLPLLTCGYIYTFCRPDGIGLQRLVAFFIGQDNLTAAKGLYGISQSLDGWIIYSLPAMLWTFSVALMAILFDIDRERRYALVATLPLGLTLGLELLQYLGLTNGTFDYGDVLAGLLGYFAALTYVQTHHLVVLKVGGLTARRLVFCLLFACVYVGDVWVS